MRALVCREWGPVEALRIENMAKPAPGPHEMVLAVKASAVNFADSLMVQGKYQTRPEFPFAPGLEAAGTVLRLGESVTRFRVGDRVMAMLDHSGFAEQVLAQEDQTFPLPDGMDFVTGGGFLTAYVSSHVAIRWQGRLEAGETMLVLGAAGGVGLTAVEIGKAMGARVIACASSAEKLGICRDHGADECIDYTTENLTERVMALTGGKGVDVCYDPVGGDLFDAAVSSLGWGGRILVVGFVAGIPKLATNRLLVKHRAALGSSLRYFRSNRPDQLRISTEELIRWYGEGKLKPLVSETFPLDRAVEAIQVLTSRRARGKVVVTV